MSHRMSQQICRKETRRQRSCSSDGCQSEREFPLQKKINYKNSYANVSYVTFKIPNNNGSVHSTSHNELAITGHSNKIDNFLLMLRKKKCIIVVLDTRESYKPV
jgi:hypothetical protein